MTNSDNDLLHLNPGAREDAMLADHLRATLIQRPIFVDHCYILEALNEVRWMLTNKSARAPGLVVCAEPGSGKTALAARIVKAYPQCEAEEGQLPVMPIVRISMTGAHDTRTVYGRVMEALKAPYTARMTRSAREVEVLHLLRRVSCALLILDEFQDVLRGSVLEQHRALDGVKLIMNELALPVFALGTNMAGRALRSDEHLAARFKHMSLPVWKKNTELVAMLKAVQSQLPLRKASSLIDDRIMQRIIAHTKGVLGPIMSLIQDAAVHAIIEGQEHINAKMIDLAICHRPDASVLTPKEVVNL